MTIEGLRNLKTGFERRLLQGMKECRIGCKKGTEAQENVKAPSIAIDARKGTLYGSY